LILGGLNIYNLVKDYNSRYNYFYLWV